MKKLLILFLCAFIFITTSFAIAEEAQQEITIIKTQQNMQQVIDENARTVTYTFTSKDSAISLTEKDFFWSVKPESQENKAYIKTDDKGNLIEADLTASQTTTWIFGQETLKVPEGARVLYKDGKLEIFGKKGESFNLKEKEKSGAEIFFLDNKGIKIEEGQIKGNFKLKFGDTPISISGLNGKEGSVKYTPSQIFPSFYLQKGSMVSYEGARISVLEQKNEGLLLNDLNGKSKQFWSSGELSLDSDDLNIKLEFDKNNPWVKSEDTKALSFEINDARFLINRNSEISCYLDSKTGRITEKNGRQLFEYTPSGIKNTFIPGEKFSSIPFTRKITGLILSDKEYTLRTTRGKHADSMSGVRKDTYASQKEFLDYIRTIEAKFPGASKEEIVTALFHEIYSNVWQSSNEMKGIPIIHKNDAIGWTDLYSYARSTEGSNAFGEVYSRFLEDNGREINAGILRENGFSTPEQVTLPDGKSVKIAHLVAGLTGHVSGRENAKTRGDSEKEGVKEGAILSYAITEGGNLYEVWDEAKKGDKGAIKKVISFIKEYSKDEETGRYPASQKMAALWSAKAKGLIDKYDKLSDLIKAIYEQNGYTLE